MLVSEFPILPCYLDLFCPLNRDYSLRANPVAVFRDLKGITLTVQQKDFFARQCTHTFGEFPDITFGEGQNDMKRRYNIPFGTANLWISNFKYSTNQSRSGQPLAMDDQGFRDFMVEVSQGKPLSKGKRNNSSVKFTKDEITDCLNKHARATKRRRGHEDLDEEYSLDQRTLNKLKKVCVLSFNIICCRLNHIID